MASALSRMDSDANSESGSAATGKAATGVKALKETKLKKHPVLLPHSPQPSPGLLAASASSPHLHPTAGSG